MTILVAVTDDPQGSAALDVALVEGERRRTGVVALNLRPGRLDAPGGATVVDRLLGVEDGDAVLEHLESDADVDLLVVGVGRRTPVGKALLGDLAQRLLLEADVPVLAVKAPA
ncbi:universal stress protein [Actinomycetospora rhizophila]|uniref:Universal stress protein n=1 Tax=Actinomycetospora rhizophila TaxID=1416876 RepID=A0ABV9ZB23_9PSEU